MGVVNNTFCNGWCNGIVVGVIGSYAVFKYGNQDCTVRTGNNGKKISALSRFVGRPIAKLFIYFRGSGRGNNRLDCRCAPFIVLTIINNYLLSTLSVQDTPCLMITAINGLPSKLLIRRLNFNHAFISSCITQNNMQEDHKSGI